MMDDQAHDMKAIGHDLGVGERASDQVALRAGEINTHNAHLMAPLKPEDKVAQIGFTAPCNDIKHSMVLEIAQSGRKALAFMKAMLIDAEHSGTL